MFSCPGYVPMETNSHICVKMKLVVAFRKTGTIQYTLRQGFCDLLPA